MVHDLDVRGCVPSHRDPHRSVIIGEILRGNFDLMDASHIYSMLIDVFDEDIDETMAFIISRSLHALDEDMIMRTGIGLAETFGKEMMVRYEVFNGLIPCTDVNYLLTYHSYRDPILIELVTNVVRYVINLTYKQSGRKGITVPRTLSSRERRIIERIFSNDIPEFQQRRYAPGFSIRPETWDDVPMVDMWHPDVLHPKPILNRHLDRIPVRTMRNFKNDILKYRNITMDERQPYVPSNSSRELTYSAMNEEQINYYLYWRTLADERRYSDCDDGYIWLYLSELINLGDEPKDVLQHMGDICMVYGSRLAEKTYCEYALINRLDFDLPNAPDSNLIMSMVCLDRLLDTGKGGPSLEGMFDICNMDRRTRQLFHHDGYTEVINRSIYAIDKEIGGIRNKYHIDPKLFKIDGYKDLRFIGTDEQHTGLIKVYNYIYSTEFLIAYSSFINNVRLHMDGSAEGRRIQGFKIDCTDIVDSVLDEIRSKKQSIIQRRLAETIELDSESISRAEDDLRSVSKMMAVPEEEEAEESIEDTSAGGEGWDAFVSSIDEKCVSYLTDLVSGKRIKKDNRLEDTINSAAMDTIGDTLIENGTLVDDYVDELKGLLL